MISLGTGGRLLDARVEGGNPWGIPASARFVGPIWPKVAEQVTKHPAAPRLGVKSFQRV
jgi:hypothetical protein